MVEISWLTRILTYKLILCYSTKKFTLPCNKKTRTVGIFLAVYDCGLIASYKEIFGH